MPNWVKNVVSFNGDPDDVRLLLETIKNEDDKRGCTGTGTIDFRKIIPVPECIFQGSLGSAEEEQYGNRTWYEWNHRHWGCKWNVHNENVGDGSLDFDTPWSVPIPVYEELSWMFKNVEIVVLYADEDIGCNCGMIDFYGGKYKEIPVDNPKSFACDLWGIDENEFEC